MLYTLAGPLTILGFDGRGHDDQGRAGGLTTNEGAHGLTEILLTRRRSPTTGRGFAGLSANSVFYNAADGRRDDRALRAGVPHSRRRALRQAGTKAITSTHHASLHACLRRATVATTSWRQSYFRRAGVGPPGLPEA